ncbi:hypothetical protein Tco_1060705 [Tanacetum coccineum]
MNKGVRWWWYVAVTAAVVAVVVFVVMMASTVCCGNGGGGCHRDGSGGSGGVHRWIEGGLAVGVETWWLGWFRRGGRWPEWWPDVGGGAGIVRGEDEGDMCV